MCWVNKTHWRTTMERAYNGNDNKTSLSDNMVNSLWAFCCCKLKPIMLNSVLTTLFLSLYRISKTRANRNAMIDKMFYKFDDILINSCKRVEWWLWIAQYNIYFLFLLTFQEIEVLVEDSEHSHFDWSLQPRQHCGVCWPG